MSLTLDVIGVGAVGLVQLGEGTAFAGAPVTPAAEPLAEPRAHGLTLVPCGDAGTTDEDGAHSSEDAEKAAQ